MCFHSKQTASAVQLQNRFKAKLAEPDAVFKSEHYHGFEHPKTPIITNAEPELIQLYQWGLIPFWAKNDEIKKSTLNARIETITEKPSFQHVTHRKCLILLNGFYEWQWLDEKGKQKQQYLLSLPDDEPFALAGLWSEWTSEQKETIHSYTIITTEARGIMREIHNSKLRMPVILSQGNERSWLMGQTKGDINPNLIARKI